MQMTKQKLFYVTVGEDTNIPENILLNIESICHVNNLNQSSKRCVICNLNYLIMYAESSGKCIEYKQTCSLCGLKNKSLYYQSSSPHCHITGISFFRNVKSAGHYILYDSRKEQCNT